MTLKACWKLVKTTETSWCNLRHKAYVASVFVLNWCKLFLVIFISTSVTYTVSTFATSTWSQWFTRKKPVSQTQKAFRWEYCRLNAYRPNKLIITMPLRPRTLHWAHTRAPSASDWGHPITFQNQVKHYFFHTMCNVTFFISCAMLLFNIMCNNACQYHAQY